MEKNAASPQIEIPGKLGGDGHRPQNALLGTALEGSEVDNLGAEGFRLGGRVGCRGCTEKTQRGDAGEHSLSHSAPPSVAAGGDLRRRILNSTLRFF